MRISKSIIKIVAFVMVVLLVNGLFNYALEPVSGASGVMWTDYSEETDLDMVFTGSSFCFRSFNPYVVDEVLGTNSFNMGTPSQAINQTYVAIKTAIEDHELDKVILAINYSSLESDWPVGAKVVFMRAKARSESFLGGIRDSLGFMLDEENREECTSINFLFPWVYNHVSIDKRSIIENIDAKLSGKTEMDPPEGDPESIYVGKGFGYYVGQLDYNTLGNANSKTYYTGEFAASAFEVIQDIITLCNENGVELIAVNAPRPSLDVVSYGEDYFVKHDRLMTLFTENGAEYYDFNLIRPEIMEIKDEYFVDIEHLNEEGANVFSAAFAKFLQIRASETDLSKYFYSPEEYLKTIDYITNVYFDAHIQEDGILIYANAYHGAGVEAEYEISLWDAESDTYKVLRPYGKEQEYLFVPEQPGTYEICVKAREVGTDVEYDRFYKMAVEY